MGFRTGGYDANFTGSLVGNRLTFTGQNPLLRNTVGATLTVITRLNANYQSGTCFPNTATIS